MTLITRTLMLGSGLASLAAATFPPKLEGVKTLKSKFHENVTISYKEPHICETTEGVKSYSGYVHLPPGFLEDVAGEPQNYPINTFFWFFEARNDPENAPLSIWLNGGPGGSSFYGLLAENGPCFVNDDSETTRLNPWSWNNHVNMLYIDEPNQVGFSYDVATNCTVALNKTSGEFSLQPANFDKGLPELNLTSRVGTFGSQDSKSTTNSTAQAGHALWHFAQTWFTEFPHYKPKNDRVSLWTESYGGHYGPGFMRFFQQQNEKIKNGTIETKHAHYLHLDTLGIINGILDLVVQQEGYLRFPFNNTYGIQVFNESFYNELIGNWTTPGGCKEQMSSCQDKLASKARLGQIGTAAQLCDFDSWCESAAEEAYLAKKHEDGGRGWFDITHSINDPFPSPAMNGYLMQEDVLRALGVPVNFTVGSEVVAERFTQNLDIVRGGFLDAVAYLLESGVKVHMMYGDRDYACNWLGGEVASLAIPYSRAEDFANAGYVPLLTGHGWDGMTRQFGNYSFSRVFQSGHMIPSYQPQAAYEVFMRAMFNKDIATGLLDVSDELATLGPDSTWHIKNIAEPGPEPRCYVLSPGTCTGDVLEKVVKGQVKTKGYWVIEETEEDQQGEGKQDGEKDSEWDGWTIINTPHDPESEMIEEVPFGYNSGGQKQMSNEL